MSEYQATHPLGTGNYEVQQGDCVSSIAFRAGHRWQTIWDDPGNQELKQKRDPNVLLPGDRVYIPPLRIKEEDRATGKRHRFVLIGVPEILRMVVKEFDEPLANQPYRLNVDGRWYEGTTDAEGKLEQEIQPDAQKGILLVGEGEEAMEYELNLGHLDPIESITGVQERLDNIGYDPGSLDGDLTEQTKAAIAAFCAAHDLDPPEDGGIDDAFLEKLKEAHGF